MRSLIHRPFWTILGTGILVAVGTGLTALVAATDVSAQDTERGAAVFGQYCAVCHGVAASGRMGPPLNMIPPEIAALPPEAVAGQLTGLIRNGIPSAMPRFLPEQISDEDIPHVVAYLFSVNGSLASPSLYDALAPIDPAAATAAGRTNFPETGHSIGGEFRDFYMLHGGAQMFGAPLSEEYWGVSQVTGGTLRMQLFERVRLELNPDAPAGQRVSLAPLGTEELRLRTHFFEEGM